MQSNGRFCAGNPSPSDSAPANSGSLGDTLPDAYPHGSQSPFVEAEPVGIMRDSLIPPTLAGGASSESLPTIPATASEVNAALNVAVTPEPVHTGLVSPSLSPATMPHKPMTDTATPAEIVISPPKQSSAEVPPTVAESEGGEADDSVSEAVPKAKDAMYWRPLPLLVVWGSCELSISIPNHGQL